MGSIEKLLAQFLHMTNDAITKTTSSGTALANRVCRIGILREALDAAPNNQKPWVYISDSQELLPTGSKRIDGLILWEQGNFWMSVPLESFAKAIRPGGGLLVIEPPDALGDGFCSMAKNVYKDERGLFKGVNCARASKSFGIQTLTEKAIMTHGLICTPSELDNASKVVKCDSGRGITWDNSSISSETITTALDGGFGVRNHPHDTSYHLLIRTHIECTEPPACKRPKPHPSFIDDWQEKYPFFSHLLAWRKEVLEEANSVRSWIPWPEKYLYDGDKNADWTVFPFCVCIPSNSVNNLTWLEDSCAACPKTAKILKNFGLVRTALFSRLGANTTLKSHRGWSVVANHILRCHVPLWLPSSPNSCGLWVEGERRTLKEGEVIVFDDSKLHNAYNTDPTGERIILIIDVERPKSIGAGLSRGKITPQFAKLISSCKELSARTLAAAATQ